MASDIEIKQFLTGNPWAAQYKPIIADCLAEFKASSPDKSAPSMATVLAVISQESGGSPWATRFEPAFAKWLQSQISKDPKKFKTYGRAISKATEMMLRSTSFGLMQLMGQTMRELGYDKQYLTAGCDARENIYLGVKFLCKLLARHGDEDSALASYNAGSPRRAANGKFVNQEYVDSVKAFKAKWGYIVDKGWI